MLILKIKALKISYEHDYFFETATGIARIHDTTLKGHGHFQIMSHP
jgi:hypothetical protein